MKQLCFTCILLAAVLLLPAQNNMTVYLKDGRSAVVDPVSKKESSMLILKNMSAGQQVYALDKIDSVRYEEALYRPVFYKDQYFMARVLFVGDLEGYKVMDNGEKDILLKEPGKDGYIRLNNDNKRGIYSYLFKNCVQADTNLLKKRTSVNDENVIHEVTRKFNCDNRSYQVQRLFMKTDFYLGVYGGMSLFMPMVSAKNVVRFVNSDAVSAKPGLMLGGKFSVVKGNRIDISLSLNYFRSTAGMYSEVKTSYYTIRDTAIYIGDYYDNSLDIDFTVKYRILKKKFTPTVFGGLYYSNKFRSECIYQYTNERDDPPTPGTLEMAPIAVGFNLGAGMQYAPVKRFNVFIDAGYKIGIGFGGPVVYKMSEGRFCLSAGVAVKLNK